MVFASAIFSIFLLFSILLMLIVTCGLCERKQKAKLTDQQKKQMPIDQKKNVRCVCNWRESFYFWHIFSAQRLRKLKRSQRAKKRRRLWKRTRSRRAKKTRRRLRRKRRKWKRSRQNARFRIHQRFQAEVSIEELWAFFLKQKNFNYPFQRMYHRRKRTTILARKFRRPFQRRICPLVWRKNVKEV